MSAITAGELRAKLGSALTAQESEDLAARLRERLTPEALANDSAQIIDELDVAWAIAAPSARTIPEVVADLGADFRLPTQALGDSGLFVAATSLPSGSAVRWHYEIAGERVGGGQ